MQSVGEQLRKARQQKGLSLEKAYRQTKIHPHVLEALEQDRAHNFLGFIYIKGFLKTYARYLGLDNEKLLQEYIGSQQAKAATSSEMLLEDEPRPVKRVNFALIFKASMVVFAGLALIVYFRYIAKVISHPTKKSAAPKVKVQVVPAATVKTEKLVLEVKAKDSCWLRVKTDNQALFEQTLPKGRHQRWEAKEKIELRIGKPEALEVTLNGKVIDLKKAKVKRRLIITHQGIVGK